MTENVLGKKRSAPEDDFPRGGGSGMTLADVRKLEKKIEKEFGGDEGTEKPKKKQKKDTQLEDEEVNVFELQKKIEVLNRKSMAEGLKIWGIVIEVSATQLRVSLPNGLEGTVDVSEASDVFAAEIQKRQEALTSDSEDENDAKDLPSLPPYFFIGQYVRCVVLGVGPGSFQLSLRLSLLHDRLPAKALKQAMLITACVESVEDHGYTLSFGIKGVTGFLRRTDHQLGSGEGSFLLPGMHIECVITKKPDSKKPLQVTTRPNKVMEATMKLDKDPDFGTVLPGAKVNAKVEKIVNNGLLVSFLSFRGHVDMFHLKEDIPKDTWRSAYEEGQVYSARILYVNPETLEVGLSLQQHLLLFSMPILPPVIGQTFQNSTIRRIDPGGILLEMTLKPVQFPAYVVSHMFSDDGARPLESDLKVGMRIKAKVCGYRPMDGVMVACTKKSVLDSGIVSFDDLWPGMKVKGKALKIIERSGELLVKLAQDVVGFVPDFHTGVRGGSLVGLQRKYGKAQEVECRVLSVAPKERKVTLTLLKELVDTELPILSDWSQVQVGVRTIGYIGGFVDAGAIVKFCGNMRGFMTNVAFGLGQGQKARDCYDKGKVMKVYIKDYNTDQQKITLVKKKIEKSGGHLDRANGQMEVEEVDAVNLWPGDIVKGKIIEKESRSFTVAIESKLRGVSCNARLDFAHLSDHPIGCNALSNVLDVGHSLNQLMVLKVGRTVLVTCKKSMISAAETLPSSFEDLKETMLLPGYISVMGKEGVTVSFLGDVSGRVFQEQLPLPLLPANRQLQLNQSVRVQVLKVNSVQRTFSVTMNVKRTGSPDALFLQTGISDLLVAQKVQLESAKGGNESVTKSVTVGKIVEVCLQSPDNDGALCTLKDNKSIECRVPTRHLPKPVPETGSTVKAFVMDITPTNAVLLTTRPALVDKGVTHHSKRPKMKPFNSLSVGEKVQGVIEHISETHLIISIPSKDNLTAFVPISDYNTQCLPLFKLFGVGQEVQGVVNVLSGKSNGFRNLVYMPLVPYVDRVGNIIGFGNKFAVRVGEKVSGEVVKIEEGFALMSLPEGWKGMLSFLEAGRNLKAIKEFEGKCAVGSQVEATVIEVNNCRPECQLSLISTESQPEPDIGTLLNGRIKSCTEFGAQVYCQFHIKGTISYINAFDKFVPDVTQYLTPGSLVRCKFCGRNNKGYAILSSRESDMGEVDSTPDQATFLADCPKHMSLDELNKGDEKPGYVLGFVKNLALVGIAGDLHGAVKSKEVVEKGVKMGQFIESRVVRIDNGRLDLTVTGDGPQELEEGKVYVGTVSSVLDYGMFVKIDAHDVSGLVHRSEISDKFVGDARKAGFSVGQQVKVSVLDGKKQSFSMKPCYVGDQDDVDQQPISNGDDNGSDFEEEMAEMNVDEQGSDADSEDPIQHDVDELDELNGSDSELEEITGSSEPDEGESDMEMEVDRTDDQPKDDVWGTLVLGDYTKGGEPDDGQDLAKIKEKKKLKKEKEVKEKEIRAEELKRLSGDNAPKNVADFERLVVGCPDSSYTWVRYMTYLISVGEISKARSVAERALETINFREEQEKFNVWVAYLNLENYYGNPPEEAVMKLLQRALPYNNPKKLYLAALDMLNHSKRTELADQVRKTMCRKFSASAKVWLRGMEHALRRSEPDEARKLFERSLTTLPKRKHVKVVTQAALIEFRMGSLDRGRDIFEGLVSNYPKRVDLWSMYVDQEIKLGDADRIRAIFERATHLTLPPKKMKFLFKRYLQYEKQYGSQDKVEHVKRRAVEYVEKAMQD